MASPMKIGVSLASLRQPLRMAVQTARRLGASAVELEAQGDLRPSQMTDTALRQLRKVLSDADLKVCAIHFPTRRGFNNIDGLDRRISATKDVMRMAYQLRAPLVVNRIGQVPEETGGPGWELLMETLHDLAAHGDRVGATFAARTGSEDGATLANLLAALPEGAIGVDFDPASLIINNHSATESLQALGHYVHQLRARDGVRDLAQGRGVETPLGRGTADFPALIGLLEDFGFRGYYTVDREDARDPIPETQNAVQFLRNVFSG